MQSTERDLSRMLGAFLRQRTPSAKHLARQIGCDPRTAEGFRAGRHWPQAKHWPAIIAAFGRDVTEAVFHPEAAAARLAEEVWALEEELAAKRAALGVVAEGRSSPAARRPSASASPEARSFEAAD